VPDLRNSRVIDIISELREYGVEPIVHDPMCDPKEAAEEYERVTLANDGKLRDLDAVILAVAHAEYRNRGLEWIKSILRPKGVVIDVKCLFSSSDFSDGDYKYWRL